MIQHILHIILALSLIDGAGFTTLLSCHTGVSPAARTSDLYVEGRKEGRKEGTCLFDINIKHNPEIYIGKIISGDSH